MLWKENKRGKEADVGSNLDSAPSQLCDFSNFLAAVLTLSPFIGNATSHRDVVKTKSNLFSDPGI